ncbi:MAG: Rieske 2Fe-2S domain-containing protein [Sandaracinaceae bacterium]|nr:Rieske 2Fe-2S domain-containing protein [Sandaracinaceae bacterium]
MTQPRFPFTSYPTGWFAVALSEELTSEAPLTLEYFGRQLVAYRGESGAAYVTDAYCPHLGAHLGHGGTVEGESIRCPFHGWRFDAQGRCDDIPYSDRIPPKAKLGSFPVREQNGIVHVFHDPQGREPWPLPALEEDGWTAGQSVVWRGLRTHPQEVFENTVDTAHIGPVHDGRQTRITEPPVRDGARMTVNIEFQAPGDVVGMYGELNDVHLEVSMYGVGCTHVRTHVTNVDVHARQQIYATPIDMERIDLRGVVQVRATDDPVFTEELAQTFYDAYCSDFAKDFPIWENKRYLDRPGLAKGDGPIGLWRKHCKQFYDEPTVVTSDVVSPRDLVGRIKERWIAPTRERLEGWLGRGSSAPSASSDGASRPPMATKAATKAAAKGTSASTRPIATAEEYFETLQDRFVPEAAKGVDAVFQWELTGDGGRTFHAQVHDGAIDIRPGPHDQPTVALVMGADDYVKVINGDLDGTWAFTNGRGKVKGSVRAAMKMRSLFPA